MSDNSFSDALQKARERLITLARDRGVAGQPLNLGDTIVIPISEIKLAFAGGGCEGKGEGETVKDELGKGAFLGGCGGGGVRVIPMALIVVKGDEITLESLEEGGK